MYRAGEAAVLWWNFVHSGKKVTKKGRKEARKKGNDFCLILLLFCLGKGDEMETS